MKLVSRIINYYNIVVVNRQEKRTSGRADDPSQGAREASPVDRSGRENGLGERLLRGITPGRPELPRVPVDRYRLERQGDRDGGVPTVDGWLVYHANTPLSKRTRHEV